MIHKELLSSANGSVLSSVPGANSPQDPAPPAFCGHCGVSWWRGANRRSQPTWASCKLNRYPRRLLAASSQRDDRTLERPSESARRRGRQCGQLLAGRACREILLGSLPVWSCDGTMRTTLRITKRGLPVDPGATRRTAEPRAYELPKNRPAWSAKSAPGPQASGTPAKQSSCPAARRFPAANVHAFESPQGGDEIATIISHRVATAFVPASRRRGAKKLGRHCFRQSRR